MMYTHQCLETPAQQGRLEIAMFEASKKHLAWIVKKEMAYHRAATSLGFRDDELSLSNRRKCVMASIIDYRLVKMLKQIENDEQHGYVPVGSLLQARRELGYTD